MIVELVPASTVVVEVYEDLEDAALLPGEEDAVARAVPPRRREFATGRACARRALRRLGREPVAIAAGSRREPRWPSGVVGSITHSGCYRACAVAEAEVVAALGIDAEPHEPMTTRVTARIAREEELALIRRLASDVPEVHWDRLLFSAKEAVYKALWPLTGRSLEFGDTSVAFDPGTGTFRAQLLTPSPVLSGREFAELSGRWSIRGDLIATAVVVEAADSPAYRRAGLP